MGVGFGRGVGFRFGGLGLRGGFEAWVVKFGFGGWVWEGCGVWVWGWV